MTQDEVIFLKIGATKNLVVGVQQLFDLLLKFGEIAVFLPDLHIGLLLRRHLQLLELLC